MVSAAPDGAPSCAALCSAWLPEPHGRVISQPLRARHCPACRRCPAVAAALPPPPPSKSLSRPSGVSCSRCPRRSGDWRCSCGSTLKLWDNCACGQPSPCRCAEGRCAPAACLLAALAPPCRLLQLAIDASTTILAPDLLQGVGARQLSAAQVPVSWVCVLPPAAALARRHRRCDGGARSHRPPDPPAAPSPLPCSFPHPPFKIPEHLPKPADPIANPPAAAAKQKAAAQAAAAALAAEQAGPKEMAIVTWLGHWQCDCGKVHKLWDSCKCGQAPPCRCAGVRVWAGLRGMLGHGSGDLRAVTSLLRAVAGFCVASTVPATSGQWQARCRARAVQRCSCAAEVAAALRPCMHMMASLLAPCGPASPCPIVRHASSLLPCREWVRGQCNISKCRFPHPPFAIPTNLPKPDDPIANPTGEQLSWSKEHLAASSGKPAANGKAPGSGDSTPVASGAASVGSDAGAANGVVEKPAAAAPPPPPSAIMQPGVSFRQALLKSQQQQNEAAAAAAAAAAPAAASSEAGAASPPAAPLAPPPPPPPPVAVPEQPPPPPPPITLSPRSQALSLAEQQAVLSPRSHPAAAAALATAVPPAPAPQQPVQQQQQQNGLSAADPVTAAPLSARGDPQVTAALGGGWNPLGGQGGSLLSVAPAAPLPAAAPQAPAPAPQPPAPAPAPVAAPAPSVAQQQAALAAQLGAPGSGAPGAAQQHMMASLASPTAAAAAQQMQGGAGSAQYTLQQALQQMALQQAQAQAQAQAKVGAGWLGGNLR